MNDLAEQHLPGRLPRTTPVSERQRLLELVPLLSTLGTGPDTALFPAGSPDLSAREIEVISLVADGWSNKQIGHRLQVSPLTVKSHLARIGRKLGVGDRAHMVAITHRTGILT